MKEINVKGNDTGIKVFINGVPDLTQIPKNITDIFVTTLEMKISEHFEITQKSKPHTDHR